MIEAQPTEYNGVRFRSKSEAIFAKGLDLAGYGVWEYEPEHWRTEDGWVPDFWVVWKSPKFHKLISVVIEYKPAMVTQSYLELLTKRFKSLGHKMDGHAEVIACGNSFSPERTTLKMRPNGEWEEIKSFFFISINEAAKHRFDLVMA